MPLTGLQKQVLKIIAANRSEQSHFAGGTILNAAEDSARFSRDFDIFHEAAAEVARASEQDVVALREAGYDVRESAGDWSEPSTFRKAKLVSGDAEIEIDWAADAAFRFFPVEPDQILGWRLHLFDMATNKALALAAR
ncbi:MAG: hypothetical protein WD342_16845 [Verrucomicrobiales bacterium]